MNIYVIHFLPDSYYFLNYLFIWLPGVLVVAGGLLSCGMQTLSCNMLVGSSSLTRDRIWAPCVGSAESFFFWKIYLFIYIFGCVGSLLLHAGFSLVVASEGYTSLRCAGFSLGGFSCCRARALGTQASVVVACRLSSCGSWTPERRLSSCGARA